jgi:deferrochelatase/peroxidase EfeB
MASPSQASEHHSLARLEFEMALEIAESDSASPTEALRKAAQSAGGDLVIVLPAPSGEGVTAVVRLREGGHSLFVQVRSAEKGFAVSGESEMDPDMLGFARTSIDLLEQIRRS